PIAGAPALTTTRPLLGLTLLLTASLALTACSGDKAESKQSQQQRRPAVPVTVASVERKTVPLEIRAIGSVEAYSVVRVKDQVGGGARAGDETEARTAPD